MSTRIITQVEVNDEQAETYRGLVSLFGEAGITCSLDEDVTGERPGVWRLMFNGVWVYIYADGTTDKDVLEEYAGFEQADFDRAGFVPLGVNGAIRRNPA